jgi:hypothetical protein
MRQTLTQRTDRACVPATASGSSPAAFPLGSLESRAAARSLIAAREVLAGAGFLVQLIRLGQRRVDRQSDPDAKCKCKTPPAGKFALCRCYSGAFRPPGPGEKGGG